MYFMPLSAHKAFPKNQHQHHIWRGICSQMAPLNTKSEGCIANNCPFEPTVAPSPSLQVLQRRGCKCTLVSPQNRLQRQFLRGTFLLPLRVAKFSLKGKQFLWLHLKNKKEIGLFFLYFAHLIVPLATPNVLTFDNKS